MLDVGFVNLGRGECVMEGSGAPQKESYFHKADECETLCMANLQCKGYSVGGLDCTIYLSGPLIAISSANTAVSYDSSTTCYGKVLRSEEGVSPIGVGSATIGDSAPLPSYNAQPPRQPREPQPPQPVVDPETQRLNELKQQGATSKHELKDLAKSLSNADQDEAQIADGVKKMGKGLSDTKEDVMKVDSATRSLQDELQKAEQAASACLELQSATRSELDIMKQGEQDISDEVARLKDALAKAEKSQVMLDDEASSLRSKLKAAKEELEKNTRKAQQLRTDLDAAKTDARKSSAGGRLSSSGNGNLLMKLGYFKTPGAP